MKRKAAIAPLSPAACHAAMATARAVAKRNGPRLVLRREEGNHVLEFSDFEEPDCLGLGWAFRGTADDEAAALLRLFLDDALRPRTAGGTIIRFELGLHFARLLAEKGALVAGELAAALDLPDRDWGRFDIPFRRLEPLIRWKLERDFRRNENPHPAAPTTHAESADGAKEPAP